MRPSPPPHSALRSRAHSMLAIAVLAVISALFCLPANVVAQEKPAADDASLIEDKPITIEELGVKIQPPKRVTVSRVVGADGFPMITISEASPMPLWQMRVSAMLPTIERPTPEKLIQDHVSKLEESGQKLTVLASKEVMVGDVAGWKAYLVDPGADDPLVNGYLIAPGKGPPFIVISFVCPLSDFARVRPTLDQSLDSVTLVSPIEIAKQREDLLKAGAAMLKSFDAAKLKKLVGIDQWFRLYRPAAGVSGDMEIGVSHFTVKEGMRGELNIEREQKEFDAGERKVGLLLTVQARVVVDVDREIYFDTLNLYWMAWDGSEEAWSIVASQRQKSASRSEAETGYRVARSIDEPADVLHVINSGIDGAKRDPKEWKLPEYYISQPLGWLLGHLLSSNNVPAGTFTYYTYDSALGNVSLREDKWDPNGEGTGRPTLITRPTANAEPFTATYDRNGNLIQRTKRDGSVTVPTTPDEIRRIWELKGLKLRSGS